MKKHRIFKIHLLTVAAIAVYAAFFACPIEKLFGIPCPGCGITRAYVCLFTLRFKEAFSYNPLFLPITATAFLAIHSGVWKWFDLKNKYTRACVCVLCILYLAVYVLRIFVIGNELLPVDITDSVLYRLIGKLGLIN